MKNHCNKSNSIISSKGKPNKAKVHTNITELTNQQPNKKCTPSKKQTKALVKADITRDTESSIETNGAKCTKKNTQQKQQQQATNWYRSSCHSNEPKNGQDSKNSKSKSTTGVKIQSNLFTPKPFTNNYSAIKKDVGNRKISSDEINAENSQQQALQLDALGAVMKSTKNQAEVVTPCSKCSSYSDTVYSMLSSPSQMQRIAQTDSSSYRGNNKYHRYSFDRNYAERRKELFSSMVPAKPDCSGTNILCALADIHTLTLIQRIGNVRKSFPLMQCGTLEEDTLDSTYHHERSKRMDVFQIDDGFHSDGGTETPPLSSSSGSSIASTSDHGSMDNVDTGGAQRLAVLSFEQVRKLNDVMDDVVYIHGRGNFPTLEVKLKDLVNLVRRKLETDIGSGGAGVIVKDVRLNGGAASHVLASEDQPYNDLDLIYAIELTSSRHFDRVKNAVLNTLMDLLPDATSKHRIMPCALKEAYVGKMVKVNNNNDGDRWSLISLGSKRGHKNVELKFVDTMRRQFEFSVDSFQIILDSLLLFYDCAALPISDNFYPTVVGESVYGDFQEAMYHLQKKLISTRQPEEIRGGGLLKYCNLLVRNYVPIDPQQMKTQERYMCSRFFIDFPDIATQTLKLDGYLADHFCGVDEEPLQYQYLMHLRDVVEMSTVCLMGHERRQTLLLIQYLAAQVLYKEHQRQQTQVMVHYEQQQQQQHHPQHHPQSQQPQQQQQQVVMDMESQQMYVSHHQTTQQQQQQNMDMQQQPQPMYIQQQQQQQQRTVKILEQIQQQQQMLLNTTLSNPPPQTIQIPSGPLGLIYANGVYYAPVIPATICTCNSTWVST